jgi:hypothetical protein
MMTYANVPIARMKGLGVDRGFRKLPVVSAPMTVVHQLAARRHTGWGGKGGAFLPVGDLDAAFGKEA